MSRYAYLYEYCKILTLFSDEIVLLTPSLCCPSIVIISFRLSFTDTFSQVTCFWVKVKENRLKYHNPVLKVHKKIETRVQRTQWCESHVLFQVIWIQETMKFMEGFRWLMMIMKHCDIFDHQNVLQRRNIQLEYGLDQGNPPTSAELQSNLQKVKKWILPRPCQERFPVVRS